MCSNAKYISEKHYINAFSMFFFLQIKLWCLGGKVSYKQRKEKSVNCIPWKIPFMLDSSYKLESYYWFLGQIKMRPDRTPTHFPSSKRPMRQI